MTQEENYHERYKRIAQTEQFKNSYCDKSLGKEESGCEIDFTTKSDDLEEEFHSWMRENCDDNGFFNQLELARHFAEWGRNHFEDKSEMVSEDLDEAANQHSKQVFHGLLVEDNITAFKAGAKWQKQKDQETIELAEDHAMLAGMNRMKEEMMENAIESIVEDWCGDFPEVTIPLNPQDFKTGDKVKIIIVKEE